MLLLPEQSRRTNEHLSLSPKAASSCIESTAIVPLGKALTGVSGYLSPLCEQVDVSANIDFHDILTTCEVGNVLVKSTIAVNGDRHERSPAILLALVLNKFKERCGGSNQDVKMNIFKGRSQHDEPTLLISLEREIPKLFEGTHNVFESW